MVRLLVVVLALSSCDSGGKKKPANEDVKVVAPADAAKPIATGPYTVSYACQHSNMPFGKGGSQRAWLADLGTKKLTSSAFAWQTETPPPKAPPPTITDLTADQIAKLEAAAVKVLAGGPFQPEYPVPEGEPCLLSILANAQTVFAIEKAYTKQPDAVSELVRAIAP